MADMSTKTLAKPIMKLLICDFDETITLRDTIFPLAQLAYLEKPQFKPVWKHFEETYMEGYTKLQQRFATGRSLPLLKPKHDVITVSNYREIFASELQYQRQCREIELNSIHEMERKSLFRDVTTDAVVEYARTNFNHSVETILRPEFSHCATSAVNCMGFELRAISINWSRELIEAVIPMGLIHPENIHCNDLLLKNDVYTGEFSKGLLTGSDKEALLSRMLDESNSGNADCWYVGDSETDLLAILHPGVNGVLLLDPEENESKFLKVTTKILGLAKSDMEDFAGDKAVGHLKFTSKQAHNGKDTACYIAKTWADVETLLKQLATV